MREQEQFLEVIDRDEAERLFQAAIDLEPVGAEVIPLAEALGRILAADVAAPVDVPNFDRSNVDGFAVHASDTFGAAEEVPRRLRLAGFESRAGRPSAAQLDAGCCAPVATGGAVPRGADAVVMIEQTDRHGDEIEVRKPVTPGANISYAASDIGRGETVLRRGQPLTSRETGVLAALGCAEIEVYRRPSVAILSTGDELVAPGEPIAPGQVYDSNARILADAVRELGGLPVPIGIVRDDPAELEARARAALQYDLVLLSGGTSKGEGDLSYRIVSSLGSPGIIVHGVALKPGKPICLASIGGKPVVILPGFPTSAIFTFHEFVAPVLRMMAGSTGAERPLLRARLPMRINSERGRTEYLLAGLIASREPQGGWLAYPMGKGSGSVTSFSKADGFITIPRHREFLDAGEEVEVTLLGRDLRPADLVVIGSHCVGLDMLLGMVERQGFRSRFLAAGSSAGLSAARRGECDIAGIHLLDPESGRYNEPFVTGELMLIRGYRRMQGLAFRKGDPRFETGDAAAAVQRALADPSCILANRNRGSGTRILTDQLLGAERPPGYAAEMKSHNAVAAAIAQERADWGLCIETVAREAGLGFIPLQEESFDFVVPRDRMSVPAVEAFLTILGSDEARAALRERGFSPGGE